jgi:hypothetical protein
MTVKNINGLPKLKSWEFSLNFTATSFFVPGLEREKIWQQQQQLVEAAKFKDAERLPKTSGNLILTLGYSRKLRFCN